MQMREWLKRWGWPAAKMLVGLAIVVAIGRHFYLDLTRLDLGNVTLHAGWLAASGVLYALALGCSAFFWERLLWALEQRPTFVAAMRGYYVGLLGKYLPGKAWALFLRAGMVKGPEVKQGVAIVTAFYEVFTTMGSGALVATLVFACWPLATNLPVHPALICLLLTLLLGVPLIPAVFNRLIGRLSRRFPDVEGFRLPPLHAGTLLLGLVIMACAWVFFGLSLWSVVQAIQDRPLPLDAAVLARYAAIMGLAYAGGFLVIFVPSGMGIRELILLKFLVPELAYDQVAVPGEVVDLAVLLLRLVWTATEVIVAGALLGVRGGGRVQTAPTDTPARSEQ
jgi:hypothetical protein